MDCNWNNPGADPARGPTAEVVYRAAKNYGFSEADSQLVASKARRLSNDGFVKVWRDTLESPAGTVASNLRDMHYGKAGRYCAGPVTRAKWSDEHHEPGLVYCADTHKCLVMFPTCGNVARLDFMWLNRPEPQYRFFDGPVEPTQINHVPEPSSLMLSLLALYCARKKA